LKTPLFPTVNAANGKVYEIPKNSLDNTTSGIYFDELKDDTKIDGYVGTDFEEASAIVGGYYHIYYTKKSDVVFNFDITADWENIADYPVTDRVSFELFLSEREYNTINDLTNIVCADFNLENGRLRCVLNANGTILELSSIGITDFVGIGNVLGLETLSCSENNIVFFNPTIKLPTTIQTLGLNINNMTENGYVLSEQWANSLSVSTGKVIDLSSNVDSVSGTDFESILISKGWTVIT